VDRHQLGPPGRASSAQCRGSDRQPSRDPERSGRRDHRRPCDATTYRPNAHRSWRGRLIRCDRLAGV